MQISTAVIQLLNTDNKGNYATVTKANFSYVILELKDNLSVKVDLMNAASILKVDDKVYFDDKGNALDLPAAEVPKTEDKPKATAAKQEGGTKRGCMPSDSIW